MSGQFRGDFTRDTFLPFKHFARVLMQQGRVQLDADWNEQAAILLQYIRTLAKDIIGPSGAVGNGFLLSAMTDSAGNPLADFAIQRGDFYVNGWLCEMNTESLPVVLGPNFDQVFVPSEQIEGVDLIPAQPARTQPQYVAVFDPNSPGQAPVIIAIPAGYDGKLALSGSFASAQNNPYISLATTYLTQPDYPVTSVADFKNGSYLAYLDVWERHICAVEDDSILEVALGGPDTASRSKVVAQVKLASNQTFKRGESKAALTLWPTLMTSWQPANRGWLLAQTSPQSAANTNPCMISPSAQYRGAENQLYRVEVHSGSGSKDAAGNPVGPTFKWSREDGSVVFKVLKLTTGTGTGSPTTQVQVASLGRDIRFGLKVGDWLEVVNDDYTLMNWAFPLQQVQAIDAATMTVTLSGAVDSRLLPDPAKGPKHPLLRRWDHKQVDQASTNVQWSTDNAIKIVEATGSPAAPWIDLENGIQIQFQPIVGNSGTANTYRTGDYWLISARTANGGEVEWPTDAVGNPVACAPHGVTHHYAPLGIVTADANSKVVGTTDVRMKITPIAQ